MIEPFCFSVEYDKFDKKICYGSCWMERYSFTIFIPP